METFSPKYNGQFIPRDDLRAGQLLLDGRNSLLTLVGKEALGQEEEERRDHHGYLNDGTKASLLRCAPQGWRHYHRGEVTHFEHKFFPHYVVTGDRFINAEDPVVRTLHYHFENVDCLVNGSDTFGAFYPTQENFIEILKAKHRRQDEISREHGWPRKPFDPKIGADPLVLYYSGQWEIARCQAEAGTITLTNIPSHSMSSSRGVGVDNEITVSIEFISASTVNQALEVLAMVHRFFELCLGKQQRFLKIEAGLVGDRDHESKTAPPTSEIYWVLRDNRLSDVVEPTHLIDVLIEVTEHQQEFETVLAGWLDSTPQMGNARDRFAACFNSETYSIDRIVGAANMYDLLPGTHVPKNIELDCQTSKAINESRERFKNLHDSFARQSILSSLGRVGMASLRDKVCHRASIIISQNPDFFSELHFPCSHAILCRNHFVHGSEASFNYEQEFFSYVFLTDTLEFVFAISDLIELGWDCNYWCSQSMTGGHAFGRYLSEYQKNLERLKDLVST